MEICKGRKECNSLSLATKYVDGRKLTPCINKPVYCACVTIKQSFNRELVCHFININLYIYILTMYVMHLYLWLINTLYKNFESDLHSLLSCEKHVSPKQQFFMIQENLFEPNLTYF